MPSTRTVGLLALLTLVPVAVYMITVGSVRIALSLVSVGVVAASLYLLLGPSEVAGRPGGH